jgi:hypothetical protein
MTAYGYRFEAYCANGRGMVAVSFEGSFVDSLTLALGETFAQGVNRWLCESYAVAA